MADPRRYYRDERLLCPECLSTLIWRKRTDKSDSLILVHVFAPKCSRSEKMYYPHVVELEPFSYDLVVGPLTQATGQNNAAGTASKG